MQTIIDLFGMIALVGGIAGAVATALLKIFGERWIGSRFDKALEELKHQQTQELEHLRFRINGLLDRTTKLNDREFEVLPAAWALTVDAFHSVREFTDRVQRYANVGLMSSAELEQFFEKSVLFETEKQGVREADDRQAFYNEAISRHDARRVLDEFQEMHRYLFKYGIFIEPNLREQLLDVDDILWEAFRERQQRMELDIKPWTFEKDAVLNDRGSKLMQTLEHAIQARLWNNEIAVNRVEG